MKRLLILLAVMAGLTVNSGFAGRRDGKDAISKQTRRKQRRDAKIERRAKRMARRMARRMMAERGLDTQAPVLDAGTTADGTPLLITQTPAQPVVAPAPTPVAVPVPVQVQPAATATAAAAADIAQLNTLPVAPQVQPRPQSIEEQAANSQAIFSQVAGANPGQIQQGMLAQRQAASDCPATLEDTKVAHALQELKHKADKVKNPKLRMTVKQIAWELGRKALHPVVTLAVVGLVYYAVGFVSGNVVRTGSRLQKIAHGYVLYSLFKKLGFESLYLIVKQAFARMFPEAAAAIDHGVTMVFDMQALAQEHPNWATALRILGWIV